MKNVGKIRVERVYVKVNSAFDETGYMQPKTIIWSDGREFPIEEVKDFHPAGVNHDSATTDCYTVVIKGKTKFLFFEKTSRNQPSRFGRWYVERQLRA